MRRRIATLLAVTLAVALVSLPMTAQAAPKLASAPSADRFLPGKASIGALKAAAASRAAVPSAGKSDLSVKSSLVAWNLTVTSDKIEYTLGTDVWLDGILTNPFVQSLQNVNVTVEYFDSGSASLGAETFPARCNVVSGGGYALYSTILTKPAGTASYTVRASGTPCGAPGIYLSQTHRYTEDYTDTGDGTRHWFYTVKNNTATTVEMIEAEAFEYNAATDPSTGNSPLWNTAVFTDVMDPSASLPDTMAPGASIDVELIGYNAEQAALPLWGAIRFEALPTPLPIANVYRFYNMKTGTHLYSADPNEVNNVIATLGWLYHFEGVSYTVDQYNSQNITPLYRFYNMKTGTHFYTADPAEKANVQNNLGATYRLDGASYFVSTTPGGLTVYRFYNLKAGTHFYTADIAERDRVIATLGYLLRYEGPSYYIAPPVR